MPIKEKLQTKVDKVNELLGDSKKEQEGTTAKLGKVADEKAVLSNRLKRKF